MNIFKMSSIYIIYSNISHDFQSKNIYNIEWPGPRLAADVGLGREVVGPAQQLNSTLHTFTLFTCLRA